MSLSHFLAKRFLKPKRGPFLKFLAVVSFAGIFFGVFCLILVMSLMNGFQRELAARLIGAEAHMDLYSEGDGIPLQKDFSFPPEVKEVRLVGEAEGLLKMGPPGAMQVRAVRVKGLEVLPEAFTRRAKIEPQSAAKEFSERHRGDKTTPVALLGDELAETLGIFPSAENEFELATPLGEIGPTGDWIPKSSQFLLAGTFRLGLYEWDALTVLIPFRTFKKLFGPTGRTGIQIWLSDPKATPFVKKRLREGHKGLEVRTFEQKHQRLFGALKLERMAMFGLLTLFALVATFSVTAFLVMFLISKSRDLAILRAIGAGPSHLRNLIFQMGLYLGTWATGLGLLAGLGATFLLKRYPIKLPETYYLEYLPIFFEPKLALFICSIALGIIILTCLYPMRWAVRFNPIPYLREE